MLLTGVDGHSHCGRIMRSGGVDGVAVDNEMSEVVVEVTQAVEAPVLALRPRVRRSTLVE